MSMSSPPGSLEPSALSPETAGVGFALGGRAEAASAARQAVLAGNGLVPASARRDVLLLMTELVTNACRHGGASPERPVRVELMRSARRLRVEVTDPGPGFEYVPAEPAPDACGGWGLLLVDRMASSWGIVGGRAGTCVWFELGLEA